MIINFEQARALVGMFGGRESEITLTEEQNGIRAHFTEYPEEGSVLLWSTDEAKETERKSTHP